MRKAKPKGTAEKVAASIEYTLLHLGASVRVGGGGFSQLNVSPWMSLDLPIVRDAMDAATVAKNREGADDRDLSSHKRPFRSAMIFGESYSGDGFVVSSVEESSGKGSAFLRSTGLIRNTRGPYLRLNHYHFQESGFHVASSDLYYRSNGRASRLAGESQWLPFAPPIVSKSNRIMRGSGSRYREYEVDAICGVSEVDLVLAMTAVCKRVWSLEIRPDLCPVSLRLPTDPAGVKELLKTREVSPGKTRREAILHWVRAHQRSKHNDPETTIQVREHLRGCRGMFRWFDLNVTVHESLADSEKAAEKSIRKTGAIQGC